MPDIKGKVYKFAGCTIRKVDKNDGVRLGAVFCGVNDDPENLPEIIRWNFLDDGDKPQPVRVVLGPEQLVHAIVKHDEYARTSLTAEFMQHVRDVAIDLGPQQLREALNLCCSVQTSSIPDCEQTFIPVSKLAR